MPSLKTLKLMTSTQLANLRPVHVMYELYYSSYVMNLDFGISDGQSEQTKYCPPQAQLPNNIKTIDVSFTRDEKFVHSIIFQGDSILTIGATDSENTEDD